MELVGKPRLFVTGTVLVIGSKNQSATVDDQNRPDSISSFSGLVVSASHNRRSTGIDLLPVGQQPQSNLIQNLLLATIPTNLGMTAEVQRAPVC